MLLNSLESPDGCCAYMAIKINFKIMTILLLINIPGQRGKRFMGITFGDGCIV